MLVVDVNNVEAYYPFMAFSDLACHLDKEACDQEPSPLAGKSYKVVLVPCRALKCVPTATFSGVNISENPGCHLLQQVSSQ